MQRRRDDKDFGEQFGEFGEQFGSFGRHRNKIPSFFGGNDPFDDPFFTHPMGSMFGSSNSFGRNHKSHNEEPRGIVIEELDSDDEGDRGGGGEDDSQKFSRIDLKEVPTVEHPSDDDDGFDEPKRTNMNYRSGGGKVEKTQSQSSGFSTHSSRVTYGGVDGAYYTSSTTRRTGGDGVIVEECQEADTTKAEATHRISRGINDKGHTLTRKMSSDGKVDSSQTLHNLNEDELAGFEETWKGNPVASLPGFSDGFNKHGNAGFSSIQQNANTLLGSGSSPPFVDKSRKAGEMGRGSESKTKKTIRINIE